MKILHTADWHLGKKLERFSRLEEQREVLDEIVAVAAAEDPDLVLVAGDLFDAFNPSAEAQELLYSTLRSLSGDGERAVVAIAGNHDSPDRVMAPEVLARSHGIILAGSPEEVVPRFRAGAVEVTGAVPGAVYLRLHRPGLAGTPIVVYLTPYANELRLRRALVGADTAPSEIGEVMALQALLQNHWQTLVRNALSHAREGVHVLLTHLLFSSNPETPPEEPEGERAIGFVGGAPALDPAVIPPEIQYVAAGHLHRPHNLGSAPPVRYSGSPLAYSFAEAEQTKSVTIVELDARGTLGEQPEVREVPLRSGRPLIRHQSSSVDQALSWLATHQDALVELRLELASFLSGSDRQRLLGVHDGVVTIVPLINRDDAPGDLGRSTDLTEDIDALFRQFFSYRHGVDPDPEMMALFAEVRATAEEPE